MTDAEIIKALETHLSNEGECGECAYFENVGSCVGIMHKDLYDLINRQKAEIDFLQSSKNFHESEFKSLKAELDLAKAFYKEKEAEFTLLNFQNTKLQADYLSMQSTLAKMSMGVEEAKAEAIKECIEKTQEFLSTKCRGVVEDNPNLDEILYGYRVEDVDEFFDNLVKEMVGDTE